MQAQFNAIKQQEFTSLYNTNQRHNHTKAIIQRVNHTRGTAPGLPLLKSAKHNFATKPAANIFHRKEKFFGRSVVDCLELTWGKKGERDGYSGMGAGTRLLRCGVRNYSRYESCAVFQHPLIS
jgi:hypothetical protein